MVILAFNNQNTMDCRPDHRVDVYLEQAQGYANLMGEIKPSSAKSNREAIIVDLVKTAYYAVIFTTFNSVALRSPTIL